jgi:hypothetical protein
MTCIGFPATPRQSQTVATEQRSLAHRAEPPILFGNVRRLRGQNARAAFQQLMTSNMVPTLGASGADWMGTVYTSTTQATRPLGVSHSAVPCGMQTSRCKVT